MEGIKLDNITVVMKGIENCFGHHDDAHDKLMKILLSHEDIMCCEHSRHNISVCYIKDDNNG